MQLLVQRYSLLITLLVVNALATVISLLWSLATPSKASDDGVLPGRAEPSSEATTVINMCAPTGHCSEAPVIMDVAEITCTPTSQHEAEDMPDTAEHVSTGDRTVDQTGSAPCQNLDVTVNFNTDDLKQQYPEQQYFYE